MDKIQKAIQEFMKKNKKDVAFLGSFMIFDDKGEVKDDLVIGYGCKKVLEIISDEQQEMLKKEKEDFVNW